MRYFSLGNTSCSRISLERLGSDCIYELVVRWKQHYYFLSYIRVNLLNNQTLFAFTLKCLRPLFNPFFVRRNICVWAEGSAPNVTITNNLVPFEQTILKDVLLTKTLNIGDSMSRQECQSALLDQLTSKYILDIQKSFLTNSKF